MKIKKIITNMIYYFLDHKKKRKVFRETFKTKLISSKSFIFFANQINKDLRSSTKFFIEKKSSSENTSGKIDIFYAGSDALEDFELNLKYQNKKFILITGDSDRTISKKLDIYKRISNNDNLLFWYSQNCISPNKKIRQIPIGLDYISQFHNSHSFGLNIHDHNLLPLKYEKKILNIIKNSPKFNSRESLIFCNYQFTFNNKDRVDCFNSVNKKYCYFLKKRIPYLDNFKKQSKFKFVLAPFGDGIDTHRVWEALLLGNIPIVKSSPLDKLYKDFPVLIVRSWKDLTYKRLMFAEKKFNNSSYFYEKLLTNYWKVKILKKKLSINKLANYEMFKTYLLNDKL
jgi:hypothetical protein